MGWNAVIEEDAEIEKREGEQVYMPVEHRGELETALREEQRGTGAWGSVTAQIFLLLTRFTNDVVKLIQ